MAHILQYKAVQVATGIVLAFLVMALVLVWVRPRVTETDIRRSVITTLQAEAPASFLVTGTLDITATTTVENTKYLFPDVLRLDLGTTRATVRMPGRVAYGFDITMLRPEEIKLGEDGVVEVALPALTVFSVEPNLERMEVQTDVGWARTHARSGQRATQQALHFAQNALRQQAVTYLEGNTQPRINTAEALRKMLTPILEATGLPTPQFRFQIGEHLVMEPEG